MDFLGLTGKSVIVFGVANKKSVAWHVARALEEIGAMVVYVVRSEERKQSLAKLLKDREVHVCDVEFEEQIIRLRDELRSRGHAFAGLLHSIAFADYTDGLKPFHETPKEAFLRSIDISCYSLIALANAFKDLLVRDASVVTISISTTTMASENYGFMAPIKAALDSSLAFLAKSFSAFSEVRFNADRRTLTWDATPGATSYNVYRGYIHRELAADFYGTHFEAGVAAEADRFVVNESAGIGGEGAAGQPEISVRANASGDEQGRAGLNGGREQVNLWMVSVERRCGDESDGIRSIRCPPAGQLVPCAGAGGRHEFRAAIGAAARERIEERFQAHAEAEVLRRVLARTIPSRSS